MFITCQPYHQKRNFKFSNNLAGKVYSNNRFLSSCSYIQSDFKLSTAGSEEEQLKFNFPPKLSQELSTGTAENRKCNRAKEVCSAVDKNHNRSNQTSIEPSIRRRSVATDRKSHQAAMPNLVPDVETKRTNILQTALTMVKQVIASKKSTRKRNLKRKLAFNPNVDSFYSPFIEVRIIDHKLKDLKELEQKSIKVNFERIYKKLIRTQLMGEFTANFMETVQRYIREIIECHEIQSNPFDVELESSLKNISRKDEFLERLLELWGKNEQEKIHELVKYYCIPSEEMSQRLLKELIDDLIIDIYEKKSCNRDIDYILLTERGYEVTHISQIYFSTMELLLTPKHTAEKNYLHYRYLIEERDRSLKMTMRQSIKQNFVEKIVYKQIDEEKVNYQEDPHEYNEYRKEIVQQATVLIESKSKLRLQAKKQKNDSEWKFDYMIQRRGSSRNDNLFTNYILRKQKEKSQYAQLLEKLRKILDPSNIYYVRSRLDESTEEQFRKLHLYNDQYDITYNHNKENSKKMFLINMIENCDIFNTKTTEQIEKLLNMLEVAYGNGDENLIQIFYWQFKEIYETARGVAHKDVIMKFVLSYLTFDQYGEMKKEDFFHVLDICLSQSGRPRRMIKEIIWNLFERMKLVVNNALNKRSLSIWYEPIKVVYMLLLSVIFGCEYGSLEDMLKDLIKNND